MESFDTRFEVTSIIFHKGHGSAFPPTPSPGAPPSHTPPGGAFPPGAPPGLQVMIRFEMAFSFTIRRLD